MRTVSLDLSGGVLIGVVNVTPDSFSDGGLYLDADTAIAHGLALARDGAAIVDVGGESTRPGSAPVSASVEIQRVLPVVEGLSAEGLLVSVDTYKPEVAEACLQAGAEVVNDVTAFKTPGMAELAAEAGCGVILMHMKGTPRDMQRDPRYEDVVGEVEEFLTARAAGLTEAGVEESRIAIDPGIGFGKTLVHNLELLGALDRLAGHGLPVVLGTSRKSFLGLLTGVEQPEGRDEVTAVTTALGFQGGARVFRVHDILRSRDALAMAAAIVAPQRWAE